MKKVLMVFIPLMAMFKMGDAQNLSFGAEISSNFHLESILPEVGLKLNIPLSKHSQFETGLFYQIRKNDGAFSINYDLYVFDVNERYLVVPFMYKFSSQIINLSFGINYNYYVGWGVASVSDENAQINNYHIEDTYLLGVQGALSKSLRLNNQFSIEPMIKVSVMVYPYSDLLAGFGLALVYNKVD